MFCFVLFCFVLTVADTALLLFLTASRHADLRNMQAIPRANGTTELSMGAHKGDLWGEKFMSKWLPEAPAHLMLRLARLVRNKPFVPYAELYTAIRPLGLTCHSLRRGAATILATAGWANEELELLTAHSNPEVQRRAIRRYVSKHPSQPEPRAILRMVSFLLQQLYSPPTRR